MLEQVAQSIEPVLMTYGIWVALFLAIMIIIPVGIVIWLQKRRGQEDSEELAVAYASIAEWRQQLNAWETSISQNQKQASHFQGHTQKQVEPILQQIDQHLSRVLRLKSELHEIEALLAQDSIQAIERLNDLGTEVYGLKPHLESIAQWFKRLNQGMASSRTVLQQIENELIPLTDSVLTQSLHERLTALKAETQPPDPLQQHSAIQKLHQDLQNIQAQESKPQPEAPQILESNASQLQTESTAPSIPVETTPAIPETISPLELKNTTDRELAESILDELLQEPEPNLRGATEPLSIDLTTGAQIEATLDTHLLEHDISTAETIETRPSDTLIMEPEAPEKALPIISPETSPETSPEQPETERQKPQPNSESTQNNTDKETKESSLLPFAEADQELDVLPELLHSIAEAHTQLVQTYASESDSELTGLKSQSQYRASEAQELLKLARHLYSLPQAPSHRSRLSLERMRTKIKDIQQIQKTLEHALQDLNAQNKGPNEKYVDNNLQTQE